jgi:hypothetical protein
MKNAILVLVLTGVLMVSAAAVFAGAPLNGTWKSTHGDFDEGTMTASGDFSGYGFTRMYARSFAGGVFTDDWTIWCINLDYATQLVARTGPTGNEIWQFNYDVSSRLGYVTLGGPGNPWNGGDALYTGILDSFVEIRTIQYVNNLVTGAVSDYAISAHLQGYPESCVSWAIGNEVLRGGINEPPSLPNATTFAHPPLQDSKGPGYPGYPELFPGFPCVLTEPAFNYGGQWGDVRDLTLSITGCTLATQPTTWGAVKAMYRK